MNGVTVISDILLAVIATLWLGAATIQDLKKREVANWLSFSLIIIALALRAIASIISADYYYFLLSIAAIAIFFGVANLLYYLKVFAGGDAKLLTAIAAVFATKPFFVPLVKSSIQNITLPINMPFLAIFILNVLFVGSFYGLLFSIFFAIKNFKSFLNEFRKLNKKYIAYIFLSPVLAFLLLLLNMRYSEYPSDLYAMRVVCVILAIFPILFTFIKAVENSSMIKVVNPSKLTEGDWIVEEIKVGKTVILPKREGLSREEIAILKKRGRKVTIKEGIPFVPVFLIALLLSFVVNLIELLIQLFFRGSSFL